MEAGKEIQGGMSGGHQIDGGRSEEGIQGGMAGGHQIDGWGQVREGDPGRNARRAIR